jgi:DNA topoisomerase-1
VKRAVFHEITRDAITRAFESPRQLATNLVHAQEARRILDRLAGQNQSRVIEGVTNSFEIALGYGFQWF